MSERFYLTKAGVEALTKQDEAVKAMVEAAERLICSENQTVRMNQSIVDSVVVGDLERAKDQVKAVETAFVWGGYYNAAQPACGGSKACACPTAKGERPCDANGLTSAEAVNGTAGDYTAYHPPQYTFVGPFNFSPEKPKPEPARNADVIAQTAVDGDAQRRHGILNRLWKAACDVERRIARGGGTAPFDNAINRLRDAIEEAEEIANGPVAVETEADRRIAQLEKERDALRADIIAEVNSRRATISKLVDDKHDLCRKLEACEAELSSRRATAFDSSNLEIQLRTEIADLRDRIDTLTYERDDARRDRDNARDERDGIENGAKMTADQLAKAEENQREAWLALAYVNHSFTLLRTVVEGYKPGESRWDDVLRRAQPLMIHPDTAAAVAEVKAKVKAIQEDVETLHSMGWLGKDAMKRLVANVANLA